MKTRVELLQLADKAEIRCAFSNGTEGYAWTSRWCDNCIHDKPARNEDWENGCPLLGVSYIVLRPNEWTENEVNYLGNQYTCSEFVKDESQ